MIRCFPLQIVQPAVDSSSRSNGGSLRREIFVLHRCKCNTGEIINRTTAGVDPATDEQPPQMNVIKIYHYGKIYHYPYGKMCHYGRI